MIRLSMAFVNEDEVAEISKVFSITKNFGMGIHVGQFEQELNEFLKTEREVICVNTGTSALHLALEALNFPPGSEVLVPSITFVASYQAISAARLVPVSCDVSFPDCHINCNDAEKRVTNKTVAIMPISYSGADFNRKGIYDLAKQFNLRVIEDNAHAFGGKNSEDVFFGASGDISCFSFDGIKNITCGEGGAIVTQDLELARIIRTKRALGIEKDVELRYKGKRAWEYDVSTQGYRYHMSNINAAIGTVQLKKIQLSWKIKRQIIMKYLSMIDHLNLNESIVPTQNFLDKEHYHIFSVILANNIDRAALRKHLLSIGFETGIHYLPNHLHSFYKSKYHLPNSEVLGNRLVSLPFHPEVTEDNIGDIMLHIKKYLANSI